MLPSVSVFAQRLAPLHVGWVILPSSTPNNPQKLEAGGLFHFIRGADGESLYKVLSPSQRRT
jgi:hypothetical protein